MKRTPTTETAENLSSKELSKLFLDHLYTEHHWTKEQLRKLHVPTEEIPLIPLSIFSVRELGSFEAIVKFLHENKSLKLGKIARLTNRNPRTIWASYNSASRKFKSAFPSLDSEYTIPIDILRGRKLSVLESIVHYLRTSSALSLTKIAKLLNRDLRTIHTVKTRATRKLDNAQGNVQKNVHRNVQDNEQNDAQNK